LLKKSPTKLYCISHTPDIADLRILKLNFAEKDHNCKPSLASSSQCVDKVYSDTRTVNKKKAQLVIQLSSCPYATKHHAMKTYGDRGNKAECSVRMIPRKRASAPNGYESGWNKATVWTRQGRENPSPAANQTAATQFVANHFKN